MINPIAFSIGPIDVYWYGIAYTVSLFSGLFYGYFLHAKGRLPLSKKSLDELMIYFVVGIVLGGRLGHVLFYEFSYFIDNPSDIFKTWQGGMSFHGGLIGATLAMVVFTRRFNENFWSTMDFLALCAPIGIFFGRIANFINGELYGIKTDVAWAVNFTGVVGMRHPTQIYEALLEGVLLFTVLNLFWFMKRLDKKPGLTCLVFLIVYGAVRFPIEFFKDMPTVYGIWSEAHILNLVMVITGIVLLRWRIINE